MVPEAPLEQTEHGLVPQKDGWYVLNARDSRWYYAEGRGAFCDFEGDQDFPQLGINVQVLWPGDPMAMSNRRPTVAEGLTEEGINAALRRLTNQARELRAELEAMRRTDIRAAATDDDQTADSRKS